MINGTFTAECSTRPDFQYVSTQPRPRAAVQLARIVVLALPRQQIALPVASITHKALAERTVAGRLGT